MKIEIDVVFDEGRLVQVFPDKEKNEEHCIHGIKLRWMCEYCDDYTDSLGPDIPDATEKGDGV